MLIDRYPAEDVFARVPELADQTDPVLLQLDHLLDDDHLFEQLRTDLVGRYRLMSFKMIHGSGTLSVVGAPKVPGSLALHGVLS